MRPSKMRAFPGYHRSPPLIPGTGRRKVIWRAAPRLLLLSLMACSAALGPLNAHAAPAPKAKHTAGKWVRISPSKVSVNPTAFNHANFGFQALAVDPKSGAVYVGTCYQGLWKSTNRGKTWAKVNTGTGGSMLDSGRLWSLVIDPTNPQVMYTTAGYGVGGVLKSTDGGKDWTNLLDSSSTAEKALRSADIASLAIDPANHNHLIASFHGVLSGQYSFKGPVIESKDGGQSWTIHPIPGGLGYPNYVHFLNNASTWLLGSTSKGLWRTTNAGATWTQVSQESVTDGGNQTFRAKNGYWYEPSFGSLQRSTNNGRTWKSVAPQFVIAPFMSVIGDGTRLYTQIAETGGDRTKRQFYYTSPERDGIRWAQYGGQTFFDGPMSMAYDPVRHIVYSSNWEAGVWKLQVR